MFLFLSDAGHTEKSIETNVPKEIFSDFNQPSADSAQSRHALQIHFVWIQLS